MRCALSHALEAGFGTVPRQMRYEGGVATNLGSGAAASLAATLLTQPFDVVRTRAMCAAAVVEWRARSIALHSSIASP